MIYRDDVTTIINIVGQLRAHAFWRGWYSALDNDEECIDTYHDEMEWLDALMKHLDMITVSKGEKSEE